MLRIAFHFNLINSQGFKDHGVHFGRLTDNTMTVKVEIIIKIAVPIKLAPATKNI